MYKLSTYSTLSLIIIKEIREKRTQLEMSLLLKKKYNVYHRWESGEQRIKLNDFLEILSHLEYDHHSIFSKAFNIQFNENQNLLSAFIKRYKILNDITILNSLEISETTLWRILNNKRDLFLDEFLLFSNYQSQRVNIFIQELGLNIKSNLLKTLDSTIEKFFLTYINTPELSVIGAAIYLKSVRAKKSKEAKLSQIAKVSCYSLTHVKKTIQYLIDNNIMYWDYSVNLDFHYFENSFTSDREKEVFHSLKTFLVRHFNKKLKCELSKAEKFHFRIASVSSNANKKISQELLCCSQRISKIIEEDDPLSRTKIIGYMATQIDF
jgi:hypothetical protein